MAGKRNEPSKQPKSEFLYGINPVNEALDSGRRRIHEILVGTGKTSDRLDAITRKAAEINTPVRRASSDEIGRLTGTDAHQNVAARVGNLPVPELEDVLAERVGDDPPFLLMLDGIEDPMNLGALARSALGAGVDAIVIPKDRAALPTPAASKASAGALEHIPVVQVTNLVNTIRDLKKQGFWVTGLDAGADEVLYDADFSHPVVLVVGGEGRGLRDLVKASCDYRVYIPQTGPVSSLNASVAGALTMYEVVRQRRAATLGDK